MGEVVCLSCYLSCRFQKYRGLKSFRTSPWDPKENLPRDYARIFQFQDFSRTRKHLFRKIEKEETEGASVAPFSLADLFPYHVPLLLIGKTYQGGGWVDQLAGSGHEAMNSDDTILLDSFSNPGMCYF